MVQLVKKMNRTFMALKPERSLTPFLGTTFQHGLVQQMQQRKSCPAADGWFQSCQIVPRYSSRLVAHSASLSFSPLRLYHTDRLSTVTTKAKEVEAIDDSLIRLHEQKDGDSKVNVLKDTSLATVINKILDDIKQLQDKLDEKHQNSKDMSIETKTQGELSIYYCMIVPH